MFFMVLLINLLNIAIGARLERNDARHGIDFQLFNIGPQPPDRLGIYALMTRIWRDQQGTFIRNPRYDYPETSLKPECPQAPDGFHLVALRQVTGSDHGESRIITEVGVSRNQPKIRSRDWRVDWGPRGGAIASQKATLEQINVTPVPVSVSCVHGSPKWR
jgi:hypothetical protein